MTNTIQNITTLIKAVADKGRAFTDARNVLVAHALLSKVSQKVISDETGLDKGDVSRINKMVGTLKPAQAKKVLSLATGNMSADNFASLADAVALGSLFRRAKQAPAAPQSKGDKTEETTDLGAVLTAWLTDATPEQFTARVTIIQNVIDTVTAEREALAAA